jgi:glutamate--cysteine ligase
LTDLLSRRLALLSRPGHLPLLARSLHGLEKESLRVHADGKLALTPHPAVLGSALTHARITTDYAEALMEFVTTTHMRQEDLLDELELIHRHAHQSLGDDMLWNQSMPGPLPPEADIPIAWYGTSNSGLLKHVYRRGLALRYGKAMQCIAGIHYNYSLAPELWSLLDTEAPGVACPGVDEAARQSEHYIAMIRNFTRYSWLLMYLFGATPALSEGFLQGRPHTLERLDADTLYLPYATSLRMSDLGYQSQAQSSLKPCYNNLQDYVDNLYGAVRQPWPAYEAIGTQSPDGDWLQLSTNILQIENEFYSSIRPKRVARRGERPLRALRERGVQYVEVRCIDINPYLPVGIDLVTCHFLDAFLLMCAIDTSPGFNCDGWCNDSGSNFATVVKEGRKPGLTLRRPDGSRPTLASWGHDLLDRIAACADVLDQAHGHTGHAAAVAAQRIALDNPDATPSARVLADMRASGVSFVEFSRTLSERHARAQRAAPLPADEAARFEQEAKASVEARQVLEASQTGSFADYVAAYHASLTDVPAPA